MVTDPPYGVDYDPDWRSKQGPVAATLRHHKPGAVGKVVNDTRVDWRAAWKLYGGDIAYVWHAGVLPHEAALSLIDSGFTIRSQIIWAKRHFAVSRGHYHHQHEPCLYVIRKGKSGNWQGGRGQSTLWDIDKPTRSETGHSAQKPVDCMKRPIDNHTVTGDSVYDPFVGSGSTIIACELTARRCLAIEIEPLHCDVAIARWEQFTGQKATLSGD
jgi:DNA modification methylase